jgi:hypothetical protein
MAEEKLPSLPFAIDMQRKPPFDLVSLGGFPKHRGTSGLLAVVSCEPVSLAWLYLTSSAATPANSTPTKGGGVARILPLIGWTIRRCGAVMSRN